MFSTTPTCLTITTLPYLKLFQDQNGQFIVFVLSEFQELNKKLLVRYSKFNSTGREKVYRDYSSTDQDEM